MFLKIESDHHIDIWRAYELPVYYPNLKGIDVYIIPGDLAEYKTAVPWLKKLAEDNPQTHIIHIFGNHGYYNENIDKADKKAVNALKGYENLHHLENNSTVINGVRFIGSCMWVDFNKNNPVDMWNSQSNMNDYNYIRYSTKYTRITPNIISGIHNKSRKYVFEELNKSEETTVVVTHHRPYIKGLHRRLWASYGVDLRKELEECEKPPVLWCYGHTHECDDVTLDYTDGKVRFISNCIGYPSEYTGYDDNLIIEI